jgi:heme exporter protein D
MVDTTTANSKDRPYKPSWIDRCTDWVEKLPIQGWVFYVGLGLALTLIQVLLLWLEGGQAKAEVLLSVIIFNGFAVPFLVALIHLLDNQAVTALDSMRSTLEMTEPEFGEFQHMLSNMPSARR